MPDLHQNQPVLTTGEPLDKARAAMIMIHGRGAAAENILELAADLARPGFTFLAPQAAGGAWYPKRFLDPTSHNEPWLSSALAAVDDVVRQVTAAGISTGRLFLLGFSQGACLALEYAARNAKRYAGIIGLSGGLIGADDEPRHNAGSLEGAPVFLGCSDTDFHIPKERVQHAANVFSQLGGKVTVRLYPDAGHSVNPDEISVVRGMMAAIT